MHALPPHVLTAAVLPYLRWHELRALHRASAATAARLRSERGEWNHALGPDAMKGRARMANALTN